MPSPSSFVAPIPQRWLKRVTPLLADGDPKAILWTIAAQAELRMVGLRSKQDAYDLCLQVLHNPGQLGECIPDMRDARDQTLCETWAFLCPHPLKVATPLYVKIGLHANHLTLNLFSLHIDRKGTLQKRIEAYLAKRK
jgi:hypothetical protein